MQDGKEVFRYKTLIRCSDYDRYFGHTDQSSKLTVEIWFILKYHVDVFK